MSRTGFAKYDKIVFISMNKVFLSAGWVILVGLSSAHCQKGNNLTNSILYPDGMTRNMVFLLKQNIKVISFQMPIANAVYEVEGKRYFVTGVPPFLNVNKDVVSGIIIVIGKASAEAFEESGRKYAYKWFSAGKVTKELCEVYRNEKSNADYPLD